MMFKAMIVSLLIMMNLQLSGMENNQRQVAKTDKQKKSEDPCEQKSASQCCICLF